MKRYGASKPIPAKNSKPLDYIFTLTDFNLNELFDIMKNQFEDFLMTKCTHIKDKDFMTSM